MAYVITATLSNGKHPENGSTQILFPLSRQEYSDAIGHLKELEAGDAVARDCVVEEIDSGYEVLGCLEGKAVNVDELDFLAKRLDSFDYHLSRVFRERAPRPGFQVEVDKKLRRRIREKKIAMGHKPDDHEQRME